MLAIARHEIEAQGFHRAKISANPPNPGAEHVLCLYYADDSRRDELADRNRLQHGCKYRYWKAGADTYAGRYSPTFLSQLSPTQRSRFQLGGDEQESG